MRGRSRRKGKGGAPRFGRHGKQRPGRQEREIATAHPSQGGPKAPTRTGELRLHRDGYGFVISTIPGEEDVFIPARYVGDAFHTDVVEVRVLPGRGGKQEGRILRVAERRVAHLMGRLERQGAGYQVVADDRRVRHRIYVPVDRLGGAKPGKNVIIHILQYPSGGAPMTGEVIEVLGERGDEATEKAAVIARHQLKREFRPAVQKEADACFKRMNEGTIASRRDLRDLPFVTIDGETAKDFDDAVAAQRLQNGVIRLWVSIADVSWFVHPQTALDAAAYERGTSVYFPGDCLPMLPEQLSNELCSLKPDVDRLTLTAEMDIDAGGNIAASRFYRSVILSRERMTYTSMKKILVDRDPAVRDRYRKLITEFEVMQECFTRLRAKRLERGTIDFDLPEPEIIIDMQGEISDIVRAERHVGHMMIEEFMIAANEAVARFLTETKTGCIYRVHEAPPIEKLREFAVLLHNLGHKLRVDREVQPGALARVVDAVRGRPEERLVNHMMLRSMAQAMYSPENAGHFGLASRCYCHFTSPIRRYPDLVVHRLLTQALDRSQPHPPLDLRRANGRTGAQKRPLKEIAEHCSRRERIAMEAERETAKLCAAVFMQGHVGEEFEGIISHVTKFGFFVELVEFFVEGLVPIDRLDDDNYAFEEQGALLRGRKKKRAFKIGDRVKVEVEEVNIPDREIVFALV